MRGDRIGLEVAARLVGRMRAPGEEKLSKREFEILQLVAKGHNNHENGNRLHISQATVKSHLIHILGKLGVSDRTAAVTVGHRGGILSLDQQVSYLSIHSRKLAVVI